MKYYVSVEETLFRVVSVEAESESDAKNKVKDAYAESRIVLDSEDFLEDSTEIKVCDDQEVFQDEESDGEYFQHID